MSLFDAGRTKLEYERAKHSGWVSEEVGRVIEVTYPAADTEVYTFKSGSTTNFVLTVVYTDSTKANISTVTRSS